MGYDMMVLDGVRRVQLAFAELRPDEWQAAWEVARRRSLPMLMTLPDFYGDERTFSPTEVRTLIGELDLLDSEPTLPPELARASQTDLGQ